MTPKFFNKMEQLSPTQESVVRYSFNMVSSSVYKIAAAAESKYPNVTQEALPVSANQTIEKASTSLTTAAPNTRLHVANAAFAATSTRDSQELEHMQQLREDIDGIHMQSEIDSTNRGTFNAA